MFRPAVLHNAAAVILVHCHPSGDPEPSEEDIAISKRLLQVGELLGIGVLDHVIVAKRGVVSLKPPASLAPATPRLTRAGAFPAPQFPFDATLAAATLKQ